MNDDDDFDIDNDISGEDILTDGRTHWLPRLVVAVTVIGFITLACYAYKKGTQSVNDEDLVVVEAEKTPLKEKPQDPGGMKFPNQDKTVFETFAGNTAPPKVERVIPAPEEPMPKKIDLSETKTWVNEAAQKKEENTAGKTEQLMGAEKPGAPVTTQALVAAPVQKPSAATPSAGDEVTSYTKAAPDKTQVVVAKKPGVVEKTVAAEKPVDVGVAEVKPDPKPFAVNPVKPEIKTTKANTSGVKVQLGAYRSDKEAREAFAKMQKKFSSLANKGAIVVRADLGAKGIFYRLRVGGFASDTEAKKFCGGLSAKGQACIIAK
jgi:hypothetical protein